MLISFFYLVNCQIPEYLYEFVNRKDIKQKLQNEIINNIFKDSDNLKEELLNKII